MDRCSIPNTPHRTVGILPRGHNEQRGVRMVGRTEVWSAEAASENAVAILEEWIPTRELALDVLERMLAAMQQGQRCGQEKALR